MLDTGNVICDCIMIVSVSDYLNVSFTVVSGWRSRTLNW